MSEGVGGFPSVTGLPVSGIVSAFNPPPFRETLLGQLLIELGVLNADGTATLPPPATVPTPALEPVQEALESALAFVTPESFPLPELLERLADLLLNPSRVPGEPCLAPAPLLRDLLDVALGRITGGIGATIAKVRQSALDLLTPAFAVGEDLVHFVEAILDDPITAALNLVLGQQGKIDCEVEGSLSVGESVIETGIRRLTEALAEALA